MPINHFQSKTKGQEELRKNVETILSQDNGNAAETGGSQSFLDAFADGLKSRINAVGTVLARAQNDNEEPVDNAEASQLAAQVEQLKAELRSVSAMTEELLTWSEEIAARTAAENRKHIVLLRSVLENIAYLVSLENNNSYTQLRNGTLQSLESHFCAGTADKIIANEFFAPGNTSGEMTPVQAADRMAYLRPKMKEAFCPRFPARQILEDVLVTLQRITYEERFELEELLKKYGIYLFRYEDVPEAALQSEFIPKTTGFTAPGVFLRRGQTWEVVVKGYYRIQPDTSR